ncbi:Hexose transporter 2 [Wickerhamomyces ciferrii]|uniref:Hexose transporter 2 n=1 Tax=Wickerhamomyces ciferrii (strain ATCC 14091 / BCRC 22168 / CBS 111 / JCM 3599 / NBRC 0793 / NRRL Y-1031 F-60-10) TaxID=1206466 RepID=K0KQ01_WICCF|nr:Hexose transporter 2 [Wickerhamomyces ciferrii]CCH45111.1 Hexose transporter 2 [Wickerhamomyces ciferrii]
MGLFRRKHSISHEEYDMDSNKPTNQQNENMGQYTSDNSSAINQIGKSPEEGNSFNEEKGGLGDQSLWQLRAVIILLVANTFTGFLFGWDTGTIGGITNMDGFKKNFAPYNASTDTYEFSTITQGLIISLFNVGCAVGSYILSKMGDWKGRRFAIFVSMIIYIIGCVVQMASAPSKKWYQYMIGRIITGLAVGATSVLTPMFISESSPLKIRGAMVCVYQLMNTLGILFGNVADFGCKTYHPGTNAEWLIPIGLGYVWAALAILGTAMMPESPFYLAFKNDKQGAINSVAKLNRLPNDDPAVLHEVNDFMAKSDAMKEETENVSWHEFLTGHPMLGWRLCIGMFIMAMQQLSGANYFFYYGTSLFTSVGLQDTYITSIILATVNCAPTFFSAYLVERFGRKQCLMAGSIGMMTCMYIYASVGGFGLYDSNGEASYSAGCAMIVFSCFSIVGFATTWGPVAYVMVSELYPIRVRGTSMALATACNWIWNFLISLFTPLITKAIGFKFGYVFAGCLTAAIFIVYMFVPETKGLTSKQIDDIYAEGHIFQYKKHAKPIESDEEVEA